MACPGGASRGRPRCAPRATPRYAAPATGAKWIAATSSGPASTPYGRVPITFSAGGNTSSNTTSWLAVPRIPSVSHVSTIETPGADSGTPACRTIASAPGSPSTAEVEMTPATGDWVQNVLRPVGR